MKSYFKSLTKSFYEKVQRVVEDEYIEPITESQVYAIINRKRRPSVHSNKNPNSILDATSKQKQDVLDNIERMSMITPEREFLLIGETYSIEVINYRMKELKTKIQAVNEHMLTGYPRNLEAIETALLYLQEIKNLHLTKQKASTLRQKLSQLKNIIERTKKITRLNIKLKNIKQTLKISEKIPNIKKMTLFQLKNINLTQINSFNKSIKSLYPLSQTKQLHCIQHLQFFIDKVASEHLRLIINSITQCLTEKFEAQKYQKAIKDFIISKSTIQYQKLLVRLVEAQIRDKIEQEINSSQQQNSLLVRCRRYISILINVSKLFRWHRYNLAVVDTSPEIEEKIRARNNSAVSNCSGKSEDKYPAINLDLEDSIKINTEEVKAHTCGLMDQCLKQQIEETLFNDTIQNEQVFEMLALINNFYQIAFSFSSYIFTESKNQIREILMRKCYKLQEKGLKQFSEALLREEQTEWNRLPVLKNYRYKSLEKTIEKMKRLHLYEKVPHSTCQNFIFLNMNYSPQNEDSFQLEMAQKKEESFELQQIDFPYDKLQKMLTFEVDDSQLPQHQDPEVVICKSSLTVLNYFNQFMSMYFYFPIQEIRNDILQKMSFYLEFYIYFIFETFLSQMYKKFFSDHHENIEQNYLHVRVKTLYSEVYQFLKNFNQKQKPKQVDVMNENSSGRGRKDSMEIAKYKSKGFSFVRGEIKESGVSQQNCVKARAIATDSIKYMVAYFAHILNHLRKYTLGQVQQVDKQKNELSNYLSRVQSYKVLQTQLSDLLLTDIVPVSTKIDFVLPLMKRIKWHQVQSSKQISEYGSLISKNIKETYEKMKSMSKGEIPYYIIDRIFNFYWRTQLTFITKVFLEDHIAHKQRGGRTSKLAFQKIVDNLYDGLVECIDQKYNGRLLANSAKNVPSSYSSERLEMFTTVYSKIKTIFPILLESEWHKCKQMLQTSLRNFEFIYKIEICILKASESCSGLSTTEVDYRQEEIDQFITTDILK